MHPTVYRAFEEISAALEIRGPVLEIGVRPGSDSLLRLPCLKHATAKIGLDLEHAGTYNGYEIVRGNANDMPQFADGQFAAVFCNATLEHDRCFWKSIAEIQRVTAAGAFIAIGVPGFAGMGIDSILGKRTLWRWPIQMLLRLVNRDVSDAATVTIGVHPFPGDYYRFSEQAVREVFMAGLVHVNVRKVMNPPRFIAWGRKP